VLARWAQPVLDVEDVKSGSDMFPVIGERDIEGAVAKQASAALKKSAGLSFTQSNVEGMIQRRKKDAGIKTEIGCRSMRGAAITNLLENGASVEEA
jgi:hypothetical protein